MTITNLKEISSNTLELERWIWSLAYANPSYIAQIAKNNLGITIDCKDSSCLWNCGIVDEIIKKLYKL